jgi:hypothetical protein
MVGVVPIGQGVVAQRTEVTETLAGAEMRSLRTFLPERPVLPPATATFRTV